MLRKLLIVFFLVVIGFSAWELYSIHAGYAKGTDAYDALVNEFVSAAETTAGSDVMQKGKRNEKTNEKNNEKANQDVIVMEGEMDVEEMISVDFDALKEVCEDVVGWLYCPGTKVNYPVVQSVNNDYYLHRLMDGEYSLGGTLFLDYRNAGDFSDWNSIVYGHNMKDGSMFAVLPDYMEQEFYEEHPVWYLLTEDMTYQIKLVGGYVTSADSDTYSIPKDSAGKTVLEKMAARSSSFDSDWIMDEEARLMTLSTCVYDYENARYVLVGALRQMDSSKQEMGGNTDGV